MTKTTTTNTSNWVITKFVKQTIQSLSQKCSDKLAGIDFPYKPTSFAGTRVYTSTNRIFMCVNNDIYIPSTTRMRHCFIFS